MFRILVRPPSSSGDTPFGVFFVLLFLKIEKNKKDYLLDSLKKDFFKIIIPFFPEVVWP
jgi:hypothetical protein